MARNVEALSKSSLLGVDILKIFVTVGTQDKSFSRLLEAVESSGVSADIAIQNGYTNFLSQHYVSRDYWSEEEFQQKLQEADLLVTHGGIGTIMQGLRLGKKVIVMPRLEKYEEHQNDHQLQITHSFEKEGYLLHWKEDVPFVDMLAKAENFIPNKIPENKDFFFEQLLAYLQREL